LLFDKKSAPRSPPRGIIDECLAGQREITMPSPHLPSTLRHLRRLIGAEAVHTLSDRQLLERFARLREEAAFAALVRRHGPLVRGVCWRVLRHEQDAEDTFQATFLVLARQASTLRWRESVAPWLYEVAFRLAMKTRVASARRLAHEKACDGQLSSPSRDEAWRDLSEVLDHELQRLPERCRAPLLLCYLDGKTRDEAAQQLGWTLATLKRRLEEGRDLLRERLARRNLALPVGMLAAYVSQSVASAAVPVSLQQATVKAGLLFAAGKSAVAVGVTSRASALADGMLASLLRAKFRSLTAVLLAVGLLSTGAGILWHHTHPSNPSASENTPGLAATALATREEPALALANNAQATKAPDRVGVIHSHHVGRVSSVAFAPAGKLLASASEDTTIRLWDSSTGGQLFQLRGHGEGVRAIAFAPSGKVLASGGYDGTVRLWDCTTGVELQRFTVGYFVDALVFHPDGRRLAVAGSFEKRLILWDTVAGKEIRQFGGEQDVVSSVAISPDGKLLASAGDDRLVRLWDIETGHERAQLAGHQDRPWVIAFSRDGKALASGGKDRILRLWEVPSGKSVRQIVGHNSEISSVAFSPDGTQLVSGGEDAPCACGM
jgi:RNA polymerase sigma factor (sigma-70 family)